MLKKILMGIIIFFGWTILFNPGLLAAEKLDRTKERQELKNSIRDKLRDETATRPGVRKLLRGGRIAVGSGELTAINETTLTVTKESKNYTVLTDGNTKFRRKFWGESSLAELTVGDKLNIIGTWDDEAKTTIKAKLVRDLSIQKRHGVFFGTINSKSEIGFTMDIVRRGSQNITVGSNTKYINRKGESISLADLAVGHRVRVRGLWNSNLSTITEVVRVKDFTLPPKTTEVPNASAD